MPLGLCACACACASILLQTTIKKKKKRKRKKSNDNKGERNIDISIIEFCSALSFQLMQTPPFPPSLSHDVYVSVPHSLRVVPFQCVLFVKTHPGFFAVLWYIIHGRCIVILLSLSSSSVCLFFFGHPFFWCFCFIRQPFVHACNTLNLAAMQSIPYIGRSKGLS